LRITWLRLGRQSGGESSLSKGLAVFDCRKLGLAAKGASFPGSWVCWRMFQEVRTARWAALTAYVTLCRRHRTAAPSPSKAGTSNARLCGSGIAAANSDPFEGMVVPFGTFGNGCHCGSFDG